MGPERDEDQVTVKTPITSVKIAVQKTAHAYFEDPMHYLFYTGLAFALVGTFFNVPLPAMFWIVTGLLALVKIYRYYDGRKQK